MGFHNTTFPTYNLKPEHLFPFSVYLHEFIYTEWLAWGSHIVQRHWVSKGLGTMAHSQCFLSGGFSVLMDKSAKNHRIKEFFPWKILWDSQPKDRPDENVNTESGRWSFFLLLLKLPHGSGPWKTQRQHSFIWRPKDVVVLSRLGQAFSILWRMALEVTNDLFWDTWQQPLSTRRPGWPKPTHSCISVKQPRG